MRHNTRFLYILKDINTFPKRKDGLVPIALRKPDFNPKRLQKEDKIKYHARLKQQKLYVRAMRNGGAKQ